MRKLQEKDLLEELRRHTGCEYLSDLRYRESGSLYWQLNNMAAEEYSGREWQEAARYLTGGCPDGLTAEESRRYLLKELKRCR